MMNKQKILCSALIAISFAAFATIKPELNARVSNANNDKFTNKAVSEAIDKFSTPPKVLSKKSDPAEVAVIKSMHWANNKGATPNMDKDGKLIFTYGQSRPTIICAPLYVCDVELEPGEIVQNANAGDRVRWNLSPAVSGHGKTKTVHLIIKAKDYNLETNAVITTDRRTYHIRLVSPAEGAKLYVTRAGFYYPENEEQAWQAQQALMAKDERTVVATLPSIDLDKISFDYDIDGNTWTENFKPVRVFDDGSKVYIQMPKTFDHREAPTLVLMGRDGKEQLVNYRLKDNYYIVDKLFDKAELIIGVGDDQRRVTLSHKCMKTSFFGNCLG